MGWGKARCVLWCISWCGVEGVLGKGSPCDDYTEVVGTTIIYDISV